MANKSRNTATATNTTTAVDNGSTAAATTPATVASVPVQHVTGLVGTPSQLIAAGATLNGQRLDTGLFAVLRKFHFNTAVKVSGYVARPVGQKGKPAEVLELMSGPGFEFKAGESVAVAE